jgi:hypothetical protein
MAAKLYQETLKGQEKADFATTTMEPHLDEVADKMQGLYLSVAEDGEVVPNARLQLDFELRLLQKSTKAIVSVDHDRHDALDARVSRRVEKNSLGLALCDHLSSLTWRIRGHYPDAVVKALGLAETADREAPEAAHGMALNVYERMVRQDFSFEPRPGRQPLDFAAFGAELLPTIQELDAALKGHAQRREAAATALDEKTKTLDLHRRIHRSIVRRSEGACWLAGLDALAQRLRLRDRRSSSGGDTEVEEVTTSGETPELVDETPVSAD